GAFDRDSFPLALQIALLPFIISSTAFGHPLLCSAYARAVLVLSISYAVMGILRSHRLQRRLSRAPCMRRAEIEFAQLPAHPTGGSMKGPNPATLFHGFGSCAINWEQKSSTPEEAALCLPRAKQPR